MTEQLEAHGLYIVFIAAVVVLVVVMTIDAIAEARRDRIRRDQFARMNTTLANIDRGLVAHRNTEARLLG